MNYLKKTAASAMALLLAGSLGACSIGGDTNWVAKFGDQTVPAGVYLIQMVEVLAALAAFLVLWRFIPFLPAALLYVFALTRILKQPLKYSIIYTVVVVLVLYLIFSVGFKVRLNIN